MWFLIAFISWILTAFLAFEFIKIRKQLNAIAVSAAALRDCKHG